MKKIILSTGVVALSLSPIAVVASCSQPTKEEGKKEESKVKKFSVKENSLLKESKLINDHLNEVIKKNKENKKISENIRVKVIKGKLIKESDSTEQLKDSVFEIQIPSDSLTAPLIEYKAVEDSEIEIEVTIKEEKSKK